MVNVPKTKTSLKRHFLFVLVEIKDLFKIVVLQKYPYKGVSKTMFLDRNPFFFAYSKIFR